MLYLKGTDTGAFAGYRACACLLGFYGTNLFKGCEKCPGSGVDCFNESRTLKHGFWWRWNNDTLRLLYLNFTQNLRHDKPSYESHLAEYPFAIPKPHKCRTAQNCRGGVNSECDRGQRGPLCEVCSPKYYKQFQTCKPCPSMKWMSVQLSVAALILLLIVAVVVWTTKRKNKKETARPMVDINVARAKIVLGFYQVTFGLVDAFSNIDWPSSLAVVAKYSKFIQLNFLQIAPVECLFPSVKVDAFLSLFAILALNVAIIMLSGLIYTLEKIFITRNGGDEKSAKISQTKEYVYRNMFFFIYITYLSTCSKTANLLPLACHKVCFDEEEEICHKYLKADYQIRCGDSRYNQLVIVAYFAIAYTVILPLASFIFLWWQQNNIRQEASKPSQNTEGRKEIFLGMKFLFQNYNDGAWYWELVETVRKVILTSGLVLVGEKSRSFIALVCVISGLYGMLFAYVKPIRDALENKLMLTSLIATFVNLGIGAVSRIPKENIPASIDVNKDSVTFQILVIGVNTLVIVLLVGKCNFITVEQQGCLTEELSS